MSAPAQKFRPFIKISAFSLLVRPALANWQPVKFSKCGRDMIIFFDGRDNSSSQSILKQLKTINRTIRQVIKQKVTVVEFRGY